DPKIQKSKAASSRRTPKMANGWWRLCEDLLDRLGRRVDDANRPADVGRVRLTDVDPEGQADAGEKIGHGDGAFLNLHAVGAGAWGSVVSTNGTPRSTSRRASRQPCPNRLRP